MNERLLDLAKLYRDALTQTLASLGRAWLGIVAIYVYAFALGIVGALSRLVPIPILAALLVGLCDALAVGALLSLVQRAVNNRPLGTSDIREAIGAYFWDVIAVGFVLWIPFLLIRQVAQVTGHGPSIVAAVSVLAAVFLNPLPEVIYQARTGSPLEDLSESARFVQQNWIEWFVPIVLVAAPLGSVLFFASASMALGGLGFDRFILIPALLTARLAEAIALPPALALWAVALGTPALTFALLLFRGHLFAALAGSTSRQRAFRRHFSG
jgi:hypothetical protein